MLNPKVISIKWQAAKVAPQEEQAKVAPQEEEAKVTPQEEQAQETPQEEQAQEVPDQTLLKLESPAMDTLGEALKSLPKLKELIIFFPTRTQTVPLPTNGSVETLTLWIQDPNVLKTILTALPNVTTIEIGRIGNEDLVPVIASTGLSLTEVKYTSSNDHIDHQYEELKAKDPTVNQHISWTHTSYLLLEKLQ